MAKKKALKIALEIGIMLVIVVAFVLINEQVTENNKCSFVPKADSFYYAYQIEDVIISENDLILKGWFFELEEVRGKRKEDDSVNKKMGVLLYDLSDKEAVNNGEGKKTTGISLNVEYTDRYDVNEYFECDYDYSKSGFVARIDMGLLDLMNKEYQIVLKPESEGKDGILTSCYIYRGQLNRIPSADMLDLDFTGTDLEKELSGGYLLASNPEKHLVIYQKGYKMYWIIDKNMYPKEKGKVDLYYTIETTQSDKLPQRDKSNGRLYHYFSSYFDSYEITKEMDCGDYRVCTRDIPLEYSVYCYTNKLQFGKNIIYQGFYRPIIQMD